MLYLSDRTIDALAVPPVSLRQALAHAFRLHGAAKTKVQPKIALALGSGHFFQSMAAVAPDLGFAAHKWVGVAQGNTARGLPSVNSLVVLSDVATGAPVALLDGNRLTALRTAAMSALAAAYLARPDSRSIGFVGCGVQAAGHLHAMRDLFPGLVRAVCVSRSEASASLLADVARAHGIGATVSTDPAAALACDVVVSSLPVSDEMVPFLDAGTLAAGSFVAAVDLGRAFRPETLGAIDIIATDDCEQAAMPSTRARLAHQGVFAADLASLVGGRAPGRTTPEQRTMFLFPGFALADLAVAVALLEAARRADVGHVMPG